MSLEDWLLEVWYGRRSAAWLAPLGWLGGAVSRARARRFRAAAGCRLPVPVVVVGNITAGGTGKTPLVLWLCGLLRKAGLRPGILCRGYRGTARDWPRLVTPQSDAAQVGDEAVLLARRSGCPVVAGPDRCAAGARLLATGVDFVVSDDGLQHLQLQRDLEIAVIDGQRGLGNRRFVPAGPLRDPVERLQTVDFVVVNGAGADAWPRALTMQVAGSTAVSLSGAERRALSAFAPRRVHAVAGIGNPERFFTLLRRHGLEVIEHVHRDHARYTAADFEFDDDLPIMMTDKDATKVSEFATPRMWTVPVEASFDGDAERLLRERMLALSGAKA